MGSNLLSKWWMLSLFVFLTGHQEPLHASWGDPDRRHFYGGYIGVEVSHLVNQFEGSPIIGYRLTPRLHAGVGAKYQYYRSRAINRVFRTHIYGPVAFSDFILVKDLDEFLPFRFMSGAFFLHGEMNYFSLPVRHFNSDNQHTDQSRFFRPTWLAGGGLRSPAGSNSYFHFLIMMDVSGHSNAIYSNPVIRFGFVF